MPITDDSFLGKESQPWNTKDAKSLLMDLTYTKQATRQQILYPDHEITPFHYTWSEKCPWDSHDLIAIRQNYFPYFLGAMRTGFELYNFTHDLLQWVVGSRKCILSGLVSDQTFWRTADNVTPGLPELHASPHMVEIQASKWSILLTKIKGKIFRKKI